MRGVIKDYEGPTGSFRALKGIDLEIQPGEFLAVVGKSGAGKTTLINMLTGVDHLTGGEVWIDGLPVHELDENRLALWRGRKMGIIYQSFYLMPTLSLLANVLLPMDFCGLYQGKRSAERGLDLLRQVDLEDHAHKLPSTISGGQQQRVAIARALANDPPIIVADEPTGRLDFGHRRADLQDLPRAGGARQDHCHGHPRPQPGPARHPHRPPGRRRDCTRGGMKRREEALIPQPLPPRAGGRGVRGKNLVLWTGEACPQNQKNLAAPFPPFVGEGPR